MFNYECDGQIDMMDYLRILNPISNPESKPNLKTGDIIYQVTFCEIDKYIVERSFDVGTMTRYIGKQDSFGGGYNSFGELDLNEYIFTDLEEAKRKADKNKLDHDILFVPDMIIEKQQTFVYYWLNWFLDGKHNLFGETIAIVNKTMVYIKKGMCYAFMYKFDNDNQAQRFYDEKLSEISSGMKSPIHSELHNMYWCGDKYSEAKYYQNGRGISNYAKTIEFDDEE